MRIRPPTPEDNEELIQLDRISPEEGLISYYVDRRPKYIRHPNAEGFFPFVAEDAGRIAGVTFSSVDELFVDGELRKCGYISSLRVHPDSRRRGVGSALIRHAVENGTEHGADLFWAVIIGKNLASLNTFRSCGFKRVGGFGFKVMTIKGRRRVTDATLRAADEEDLDDMANVLDSFYRGHNFRPKDTIDWLTSHFRTRKNSLGAYYVAERGGEIVATARATRQWKITRMIITRLSAPFKMANLLLRLGAKEGSLLKLLDISDLAFLPGEMDSALDLTNHALMDHQGECRLAYLQHGTATEEERFMARARGLSGSSDVVAMSPNRQLEDLNPVFASR